MEDRRKICNFIILFIIIVMIDNNNFLKK